MKCVLENGFDVTKINSFLATVRVTPKHCYYHFHNLSKYYYKNVLSICLLYKSFKENKQMCIRQYVY